MSEKEPTGSDAPMPATTGAAEDNKPVTEEKPNTPDSENQQRTDEHQAEAQEKDTEQEVIISRSQIVCFRWWCLPNLLQSLLLVCFPVILGFDS